MPELVEDRVEQYFRGFLLAEQAALKAKLSGIKIPPRRVGDNERRVRTYYRFPTEAKLKVYPFIVIQFLTMEFAADRAHSAQMLPVDYWPSEYATFQEYADANGITAYIGSAGSAEAVSWHPYNLMFQIETHTRNELDDAYLTGLLIGTAYLPDRWGYLPIPEDGSERWLDRLDMRNADYIEGDPQGMDQRVLRKVYTISVSAHVPPELPFAYLQVLRVVGNLRRIPSVGTVVDPETGYTYSGWINEGEPLP